MTDFTRDRDDQHGPLPVGFTTHSFDDTIAPVYLDQVTRREIDRWVAALLAQGVRFDRRRPRPRRKKIE